MTSPDKHPQAAEQRPLQGPEYVAEMRALNHPATHILKTWPPYFADILEGRKHFEARRDDRDFRVGDYLDLIEYDMNDGAEMGLHTTGRSVMKRIGYKLDGGQFGIEAGYCVLGLEDARLASTEGREGVVATDREKAKALMLESPYPIWPADAEERIAGLFAALRASAPAASSGIESKPDATPQLIDNKTVTGPHTSLPLSEIIEQLDMGTSCSTAADTNLMMDAAHFLRQSVDQIAYTERLEYEERILAAEMEVERLKKPTPPWED